MRGEHKLPNGNTLKTLGIIPACAGSTDLSSRPCFLQ